MVMERKSPPDHEIPTAQSLRDGWPTTATVSATTPTDLRILGAGGRLVRTPTGEVYAPKSLTNVPVALSLLP